MRQQVADLVSPKAEERAMPAVQPPPEPTMDMIDEELDRVSTDRREQEVALAAVLEQAGIEPSPDAGTRIVAGTVVDDMDNCPVATTADTAGHRSGRAVPPPLSRTTQDNTATSELPTREPAVSVTAPGHALPGGPAGRRRARSGIERDIDDDAFNDIVNGFGDQTAPSTSRAQPSVVHRVARIMAVLLGVGGFLGAAAAMVYYDLTRDVSEGVAYASGDKPSESRRSCSKSACAGINGLQWELPAGRSVTTVLNLDQPGNGQALQGSFKLNGFTTRCTNATVQWKITADITQIASGTLAAPDTTPEGRKLAESLPAQADTVTITAQRTDDEACETLLQWESAGVA
ncbi:hypothetical protein J7E87_09955 [Streptomyces sp. ISL-1]|uniref:hypothetical protein n=1 Tax=Streptomyces sp. ISL-1 TaxID=2817657 RepID=UPI001BECA283|nr:hypothetical protein [Streptomyces sp. ISL-1]MBT2389748.1 hypothetical protein [Streptomyces sp. ISL-1]